MEECSLKRRRLDDEEQRSTAVQPQNTSLTPQLNRLPLTNEVIVHMTSFLGGNEGSFADRIRVAAICRQLSLGVISSMRRMGERYVEIDITDDHILIGGIRVENNLSPPKDQMECVLALMAFGQPTQLCLDDYDSREKGRRLIDVHRILSSVPSLSITRLWLRLHIGQFSGQTPFIDIMEVIGGMKNLETLHICCGCEETPALLAHRSSLPSVPENSPFNHLLKLERLRGLTIRAPDLVSPKQQADLINRSPSTINHLCCWVPGVEDNRKMLSSMNAVVRANITSACCWGVHFPTCLQLLTNLPNCQSICCQYMSGHPLSTPQRINAMVGDLLNHCHRNDDHRGKTLQLKIGLFPDKLQEYLGNGGQTEFNNHNREQTVVSVTVGPWGCINDADCPFKRTKKHDL